MRVALDCGPLLDPPTGVGRYVDEVRERSFPEEQHTYAMPEEELALFEAALEDVAQRS